MRSIPSATQTELAKQYATEPMVVIEIAWPTSGTVYYADKAVTFNSVACKPYIVSLASLATQLKSASLGEVSAINIKLDDTTGDLKNVINRNIVDGSSVKVYHYYELLSSTDAVLVFVGKIASEVSWSEGERTLDITVESLLGAQEVGFAPDPGFFGTSMEPGAARSALPLCFGTCLRVPAKRVIGKGIGTLTTELVDTNDGMGDHTNTTVYVEGGEGQPQGVTTDIYIQGVRFTGSFNGRLFNVTTYNVPYYTSLAVAARGSDAEANDASVAWISDASKNLTGLFVYMVSGGQYAINKCIRQEGTKCYFAGSWAFSIVDDEAVDGLPAGGDTIVSVAGAVHSSWSNDAVVCYLDRYKRLSAVDVSEKGYKCEAGSYVAASPSHNYLFVPNCIPSTDVVEVLAEFTEGETTLLRPVPSGYYTVTLTNTINGRAMTTITLAEPLSSKKYPENLNWSWGDEIYVTLKSSVGNNTADIISWILTNYTSITPDATSFAAVKTKLANYPSNFALFDLRDAITLCEDIAWQARCALVIRNGTAYIKYLSETPTSQATVDESSTLLKSVGLSFNSVDEAITSLTATWRKNYYDPNREYLYTNNQDVYGIRTMEKDFFIYNIQSLVELSAIFWGYRLSNVWRKMSFSTLINKLAIEPLDCVTIDVNALSTNNIRGLISAVAHDTAEHQININIDLASKAGAVDGGGQPTEDTSFFTAGQTYPSVPPDDPVDNLPVSGNLPADTEKPWWDYFNIGSTRKRQKYELEFLIEPVEVIRHKAFGLSLRLKSQDGRTIRRSLYVVLKLTSSDTGDVLSETEVKLVSGVWTSTTIEISGTGSGNDDYGFISAAARNHDHRVEPTQTSTFKILDETYAYYFVHVPQVVSRNEAFEVEAHGEAAAVQTIFLESPDSNDVLLPFAPEFTFDAQGEDKEKVQIHGGVGEVEARLYMLIGGKEVYSEYFRIVDQDKLYTAKIISYNAGTDRYTADLYKAEGPNETPVVSGAVVEVMNHDSSHPIEADTKLWVIRRAVLLPGLVDTEIVYQGYLRPINGWDDTHMLFWSAASKEYEPKNILDLGGLAIDHAQEYPFITYGSIPVSAGSKHKHITSSYLIDHLLRKVAGYSAPFDRVLCTYGGLPQYVDPVGMPSMEQIRVHGGAIQQRTVPLYHEVNGSGLELKLDEPNATPWADIWYPGDISLVSTAWIEERQWTSDGIEQKRTVPLDWQVDINGDTELFVDTDNATAWVDVFDAQGVGLIVDSSGAIPQLQVLPEPNKGVAVSVDGVAVVLDAAGGLSCGADGLAIKLDTDSGLWCDANGLAVDAADASIDIDGTGISVNLDATGGLTVSVDGLAVEAADNSIYVNGSGVGVNLKTAGGLEVVTGGVAAKLDTVGGLSVSSDGLAVEAADNSIYVNGSGVGVNLKTDGGLAVVTGGVSLDIDTTAIDVVTSVDYNATTGVLSMTKTPLSIQLVSGKLTLVGGTPATTTIATSSLCP